MSIYTKVGDQGDTVRPGGVKARKSDVMIVALGVLDELNSHVGSCLAASRADARLLEISEAISPVQGELLSAGAVLAAQGTGSDPHVHADGAAVARMEKQIDRLWASLPELTHFILPGGCDLACRLHLARTVCRRAERTVVKVVDAGTAVPLSILQYLNRLSDLLFALARWANHQTGTAETPWLRP